MSTSIYNIQSWAQNTQYRKNDIVKNGSTYYYAKEDHVSSSSHADINETIAANPSLWGGTAIDPYNGATKPQFIWTPSYSSDVSLSPRVKIIKFGDGYEQRITDGINTILINIDFLFDGRSIEETTAILHFFYEKAGVKSFLFTPSPPHNIIKRFVCRNWSHQNQFYNNHSIKAKFEEVAS